MYERRRTLYEKAALAGTGVRKNSTVACGFSPIKIHYSDYPKRFNVVYDFFFNKRQCIAIIENTFAIFIALVIVECCYCLFRCNHTCCFCDVNVTLSK